MVSTVSRIPSPGAGNIEKASTPFEYKFDRIDGNWYVDASREGNIARFPYKGFYTLRLVQKIAVGVLAVLAISLLMSRRCFAATPLLDVVMIIDIVAWAVLGCLWIDALNENDPITLANKRNFLLQNCIADANSPLLTDYEKVQHFAYDPHLSTKDHVDVCFEAIGIRRLPGFTMTSEARRLWDKTLGDMGRARSSEMIKAKFPGYVKTLQAITQANLSGMTLSRILAA